MTTFSMVNQHDDLALGIGVLKYKEVIAFACSLYQDSLPFCLGYISTLSNKQGHSQNIH